MSNALYPLRLLIEMVNRSDTDEDRSHRLVSLAIWVSTVPELWAIVARLDLEKARQSVQLAISDRRIPHPGSLEEAVATGYCLLIPNESRTAPLYIITESTGSFDALFRTFIQPLLNYLLEKLEASQPAV